MTKSTKSQPTAEAQIDTDAAAPMFRAGTKLAAVVDMLNRDTGASLTDLTATTGWLPHTARAALTGLRKRGLTITQSKVDDVTRYFIVAA